MREVEFLLFFFFLFLFVSLSSCFLGSNYSRLPTLIDVLGFTKACVYIGINRTES